MKISFKIGPVLVCLIWSCLQMNLMSSVDNPSLKEILPNKSDVETLKNLLASKIPPDKMLSVQGENKAKLKVRLNIFIHGTTGSILTGFSPHRIFHNTDLSNSWAERFVRKTYRQDFFLHFDSSPLYHEGFFRVAITPKDALEEAHKGLALFPILQAFDLARKAQNEGIIELYYVFGWSGMLSQHERIKASVCLYNAIVQELTDVQGALADLEMPDAQVTTEILAHSHGSNVSLMLALVDSKIRNNNNAEQCYALFDHGYAYRKQLATLEEILEKHCAPKSADAGEETTFAPVHPFPMEKWLFYPQALKSKEVLVERVYMLAGPVQAENYPLAFCKTFDRVENWYSPSDKIQKCDVFSVQSRQCERLVELKSVISGNKKSRVVVTENGQKELLTKGFLQREVVFSCGRTKVGPSHLEFWMTNFKKQDQNPSLRPLPFVCLIPFLANKPEIANEEHSSLWVSFGTINDKLELVCQPDSSPEKKFIIPIEDVKAMKGVIIDSQDLLTGHALVKGKSKIAKLFLEVRQKLIDAFGTS